MPDTVNLRQATDPAPAPTAAAPAEPLLVWETTEFHPQPKTALWYALFGIVLAVLLFAAFLLRSFLSGVVFILSGILILLHSERPPRPIRVHIGRDALTINDRRYLFQNLEGFNIVESPTGMLALFRSKRFVMPLLHLPLGDQDPDAVREALRRGVAEDLELREPFPDLLAHWLGF